MTDIITDFAAIAKLARFRDTPPQSEEVSAGFKLVAELPRSDKPWDMVAVNGLVVLANPDHPPMMLSDSGELQAIPFLGEHWTEVGFFGAPNNHDIGEGS